MDATEGVLATVMLWVDRSTWRGRCGDSIPTEWVTYHDNVVARDKIVRVRYESISLRKTQDRRYFDGRGFGNGHASGATQDTCVVGSWSIELTGIECSSKLLEGRMRRAGVGRGRIM